MSTLANDYGITDEINGNGNGHSNGNGNGKSPASAASEKAWETARAAAVEQERKALKPFFRQLDEQIRATHDKELSDGAVRLFNLLCFAGWKKEYGGLYKNTVGRIQCEARLLAKMCGGASVNSFYHKTRPEKRDARGAIIRHASQTDGWIEQLIRGNYIWISKHRIPNIPPPKWPNVYNVACHVPREHQQNLNWVDGAFGAENVINDSCPSPGDRLFSAQNAPGDSESPVNVPPSHQNGGLPVPRNGNGQVAKRGTGNHQSGGRAITVAGDCQLPKRGTGNHQSGGQAITVAGDGQSSHAVHIREIGEVDQTSKIQRGGGDEKKAPPVSRAGEGVNGWETEFDQWKAKLPKKFDRELRATLADLTEERTGLKEFGAGKPGTPEALRRVNLKIAAVKAALNGPGVKS